LLISENYRELNAKLHESNSNYGKTGLKYASFVLDMCKQFFSNDVLDYGCGKRTLEAKLVKHGINVTNYDPALPEFCSIPEPHDIVVCTDVLEHIEPEFLDNVLDDLARVTKRAGFFTIATRPAQKTLEDGRNAHLIQQEFRWWLPKLWERFELRMYNATTHWKEFIVIVEPHK